MLTPDDVLGGDPVVGVFVGVVYNILTHDGYNTDPVQRRVSVPTSQVILIAIKACDLHYSCCEHRRKTQLLSHVHLQVPHCKILRQRFRLCGIVPKKSDLPSGIGKMSRQKSVIMLQ